jgi:hypothetical protein
MKKSIITIKKDWREYVIDEYRSWSGMVEKLKPNSRFSHINAPATQQNSGNSGELVMQKGSKESLLGHEYALSVHQHVDPCMLIRH